MKKIFMKKALLNAFMFLAVFAIATTSCKKEGCTDPTATNYDEKAKDDDGSCLFDNGIDHNNFTGDITTDVTLDAALTYKLTGMLKVKSGGKLRIPAGTVIEGVGGTSAAIIVEMGGQIFVNGTATNPVVMTSGLATKSRGDWGGLVICGRAPINAGAGRMSEVGDVPYGGTDANDNSGTIRYLRIEWSAAAFNSEKEYNGFSLFGVGSGTTVEYVQIIECADDPIEFYGGTVHANYIVCVNGEDDQFDWTEGWTGGGQYWYGNASDGFGNRGFECDNWSGNHSAVPFAYPTISNVTLIGSGDQGSEPQGLMLRAGTKGSIDNIVISNYKIGIEVRGDVSVANLLANTLNVTNVKFDNITTKLVVKDDASAVITDETHEVIYTENANATGAGNGVGVPTWTQGWTIGL